MLQLGPSPLQCTWSRAAGEQSGGFGQRGKPGGLRFAPSGAEIVSLPFTLMTQLLASLKRNGSRKGGRVTADGGRFSCTICIAE